MILQKAPEEERNDPLSREWYARSKETDSKLGNRNGYYPRNIKSTEGKLSIEVPRVRNVEEPFTRELLSRIKSIENNLKRLAVELYVRG